MQARTDVLHLAVSGAGPPQRPRLGERPAVTLGPAALSAAPTGAPLRALRAGDRSTARSAVQRRLGGRAQVVNRPQVSMRHLIGWSESKA
jgi:hypothetical protein